jgi:hypothetical protein
MADVFRKARRPWEKTMNLLARRGSALWPSPGKAQVKLRLRYWLTCVGCALLCGTALAQNPASVGLLGAREQILAQLERMPEGRLKALFLRCSREAEQRQFGLDEGAMCSMASDAIKRRSFGGNFDALLAWWRVHRDDPDEEGHVADPLALEPYGPSR